MQHSCPRTDFQGPTNSVFEIKYTVMTAAQHSTAQHRWWKKLTWSSGRMTVLKAKAMDPIAPIALNVPVAVVS